MKTMPKQASGVIGGTATTTPPMAELLLSFNFSPIPAAYFGVVTARLGELYKQTTGDDLYVVAAEMGSLKLRLRALKRHLEPFILVLGLVFTRRLTPENVEKTVDDNVEAVVNTYVDRHQKLQAEIVGLNAEVAKNNTEMKLKAVMGLTAFVRECTQYRKDFDTTATPEDLMRAGSAAAAFYAAILDLGETRLLGESLGLNLSIQDLKDNITIQFRDPTEEGHD